jgi:ribonuclease P protein component
VGQKVELEGERPAASAPGIGWIGGRPAQGREVRLRRPADFERVRQEGRAWFHPLLVLVAAPNLVGPTRVGVVAGRRVGPAVARNRAKRLLREAARHLYPRLMPGWDLILIARPPILTVKEPQVEAALEQLAREAGLLQTQEEAR